MTIKAHEVKVFQNKFAPPSYGAVAWTLVLVNWAQFRPLGSTVI